MRNEPRWLVLSDGARPTEDIYFLESAAPFLRSKGVGVSRLEVGSWRWPIMRRVFSRRAGLNLMLCRTLPKSAVNWLERERDRFERIFYLIDDDLGAAAADETLPAAYRERMKKAAALQPRLLALADDVVTCSGALAERFNEAHSNVAVLTPPLITPLPGLEHFTSGPDNATPWRIGFHGTRAHMADLLHIAPALERLQRERRDTELELMLGSHAPVRLAELPRTICPEPLRWGKFREYQANRRVHIGLAPLLGTPFNRGKSFIKFLDIAVMGGVGVYSRRYPYTEIVEDGVNGLLADDAPTDWLRCLGWLLDHPREAIRMAEAAAETARQVGDVRQALEFWRERS